MTLHGVLGFVVLVLARPKSPVVQRGLSGRRSNRVASMALAAVVIGALFTGLIHTLDIWEPFGVWSPIGLHVVFAIGAVPLAALHVVTRPQRIRPVDLSRRTWLQALGVAGVALGLHTVFDRWVASDRRFTGSHEVGSGQPRKMPVVQWFNDSPPHIDPADWVLRVRGSIERDVDYQELAAHTTTKETTAGLHQRVVQHADLDRRQLGRPARSGPHWPQPGGALGYWLHPPLSHRRCRQDDVGPSSGREAAVAWPRRPGSFGGPRSGGDSGGSSG